MPNIDEMQKEIRLDEEGQDAVLIVSKTGQVLMVEPPYDGPMPQHVQIVEGLCKALSSPVLFPEVMDLVNRAQMGAPVDLIPPPTIN
ncbi:MAG: hypothetical protein GY794_16080 [bacterium]|nr:hypothetical protein [bacterium]